jgi:methylmalonyl-CoA carboxyltransferase small subunit
VKLKITIDGKSYEADVEILEEDEAAPIPSYPPLPLAAPPSPAEECWSLDACLSPVMGLVIRVNVKCGQKVIEGEIVAVVESMKMENSLSAPRNATVKAIKVKPGDSVKVGQCLIEFD